MTRITSLAAIGFAAAILPATGAQAEPFTCNGSPDIPETYVCIERFTVGVDPVVEPLTVDSDGSTVSTPGNATVPSMTVTTPAQTVGVDPMVFTVPAEPVHIPQVCAVVCFGPFDTTTPPVTQTTPGISQTVPSINQTTPEISQDLPQTTVDTPPVHLTLPAPFVSLYPEPVLVLSYLNECYYVYPSGRIRQADMVAGECP